MVERNEILIRLHTRLCEAWTEVAAASLELAKETDSEDYLFDAEEAIECVKRHRELAERYTGNENQTHSNHGRETRALREIRTPNG